MVLPTVGAQSGNRLAQMLAASAQQKRGLAMQAQFGGMDERRRKMDRLHALLQQRMQWVQEREARKRAEKSGKYAALGGKVGSLFGLQGAGIGSSVGGLWDPDPERGMAMGQSLMSTANQGMSLMDKMRGMGLLQGVPTETPIFGQGGGS